MSLSAALEILRSLERELWIVTAEHHGRRGGLVAASVMSVSSVPELPRVVVALAHGHVTTGLVAAAGAFGLHLIAAEQAERAWTFGLRSGADSALDKFAGLTVETGRTGAPLLADAPARLECVVEERFDIGDRWLFLANVVDGAGLPKGPVLTMKRLIAEATPERRSLLRAQLDADATKEGEAIRHWREVRSLPQTD